MSKAGVKDMKQAIASLERARAVLPENAPPVVEDPIAELRRWRLQASVRFVGKALQVARERVILEGMARVEGKKGK